MATIRYDLTSTGYRALIPRQTAPPTTIRDPYLGSIVDHLPSANQSVGVANYLSGLSVFDVSTVGNTTYWKAVEASKGQEPVSLFVTDRITQFDWRYYQADPTSDGTTWDVIRSCDVGTQHFGTTSQVVHLECLSTVMTPSPSGSSSVTVTRVASTVDSYIPGPATIIIQNGAKTTPAPNSTSSAGSTSSESS